MSYNPTAPGGPVVCPSNALPVIDRTRSQCGQTIQVPSSGLWYTLYVTAIRGDTTFGVDPDKLVQVYPSQVSISAGQWDCDPTVFGHILKGSTCRYKFFVQASTTGSVKFVLTAGGDSCTVYFAPQGAQPTPSPTPSPTPPQPQPTAPSCDVLFPPPCDRPGYTCIQAMGLCCCMKQTQAPTPQPSPTPTAPPQPPQPRPCPSGTSCLDYSLCETSGGTCESDCVVGCCCRKITPPPPPTPSPTPQPSPPPVPTPSPSPKPECPTGTVCVDPSLCGGGGTCVSSCSLGCCCQPPSNIPPPPPPAPQPPGPGRKPQPY